MLANNMVASDTLQENNTVLCEVSIGIQKKPGDLPPQVRICLTVPERFSFVKNRMVELPGKTLCQELEGIEGIPQAFGQLMAKVKRGDLGKHSDKEAVAAFLSEFYEKNKEAWSKA